MGLKTETGSIILCYTLLSQLSEENKAIATNKNWKLA